MDINDVKRKKIQEEEITPEDINLSKNNATKEGLKIQSKDRLIDVGTQKREVLENGQRVMSFSLDPEALKKLDTYSGKYRVYIDNEHFKGNDAFKRKYVEIDKESLNQIKPSEDGKIQLIAYEKNPGGDVTTKSKAENEIFITKDTAEIRKSIAEKNPEVKYKGEEDIYKKAKLFDTPISPTLNFRDIYQNMSKTEKGEIDKLNATELKEKIEENRPMLSKIDERYVDKLKVEITTPDKTLKMVDENNQTCSVKYVGNSKEGNPTYEKKDGSQVKLNYFEAMQKIRPLNNDQLFKDSVRETINETNLSQNKGQEKNNVVTIENLTDKMVEKSNRQPKESKLKV